MQSYSEVLDFLYQRLPIFHREGKKALKPGLENIISLCEAFGNPQENLKCIHIAGTNGKGSSSHFMASILQEAGYKVGLYTSPHLKNFTERFKIDGIEIPEVWITQFVIKHKDFILNSNASFFEWTVLFAFLYFKEEKVDIAIIETGLGGRLDSTNIIRPLASLITNISFDHQDVLGNTLQEIASEKAGIIKNKIPVTISEYKSETKDIFILKAKDLEAPFQFSEEDCFVSISENDYKGFQKYDVKSQFYGDFAVYSALLGLYQQKNIQGIIALCSQLSKLTILKIPLAALKKGIQNVQINTNLKGRFQILQEVNPKIIVDTAHNEAGISQVLEQVEISDSQRLRIIIGMVKDKDVNKVLQILPKEADYIFTEINNPRKLPVEELEELAKKLGLLGKTCKNVNEALLQVREESNEFPRVLVIGSTYLIAEINEL